MLADEFFKAIFSKKEKDLELFSKKAYSCWMQIPTKEREVALKELKSTLKKLKNSIEPIKKDLEKLNFGTTKSFNKISNNSNVANKKINKSSRGKHGASITNMVRTNVDEITNKKSYSVYSELIHPTRKLRFPYGNLQSFIGFTCDASSKKNGWIAVGFTKDPNIIEGEYTGRNLKIFKSRVRWDNKVEQIDFISNIRTSISLLPKDNGNFFNNINKHSKLKIELKFYQEGNIYFEYKDLKKFSEAIKLAKSKCRALKV